ncbi:MAG TPA: FAD-dependent oxidoreductase [Candidatus Acidoferrales bacterium]|nr:FAD-dependent oxidoreductase [Candidatus Acidoferrales bacterium]
MDRANIVIIGGGVIGCAIAMELAAAHRDVFVLEAAPHVGMGASTRNSGVLHSGIYYTPGSLKARLCVEGNRLSHEFCEANSVPLHRTGKIVIATEQNQVHALEELAERGRTNGVSGLEVIDRGAMKAREPHVSGVAALSVPSASIVSAEELVKAYARIAAQRGANIVTRALVTGLEARNGVIEVTVEIGEAVGHGTGIAAEKIEAACVINSAGLYADEIAAMLGNLQYRIYPVRGEYCEVVKSRADLVRGLVYPLPHAHGMSLGVHLTRTVWGTVLVGPTAHYVEEKTDYEKNRLPVEEFVRMAHPLLPELRASDLRLAYSGLRAKLVPPLDASGNEPATGAVDWVIRRDPATPRAIHLIGMESPGLTSALAIARHIAPMVAETLS